MSELTPCNYCNLEAMKHKAEARGVTVVVGVIDDLLDEMHGWTWARYSDEARPSAWFMQVTKECVC